MFVSNGIIRAHPGAVGVPVVSVLCVETCDFVVLTPVTCQLFSFNKVMNHDAKD